MTIGDRIKYIRGGQTREEFASKIRIDKSTAQRYETANNIPKGDVLQRIHDVFNVDINWLLTGEGEPYIEGGEEDKEKGLSVDGPAEEFKLSEALTMAARVLESRTSYAAALYLNIQHFDRAIQAEARITLLERKNEELERRITALETRHGPTNHEHEESPHKKAM